MRPFLHADVSFVGGIECTYLPAYDLDLSESSGHQESLREDLVGLSGRVRWVRYPIRWHRIERARGRFDWADTDRALAELQAQGLEPIVDLLHHTSYPRWLGDGLRDPRFGPAYVRFARAVAERYPWLRAYTLLNEPFTTFLFAGQESLWPPYDHGIAGFARLAVNVLPALTEAATAWRLICPDALHVWVDTCEAHRSEEGSAAQYAAYANDRRHALLDLVLGQDLRDERPFLADLRRAGAERLWDLAPLRVDVLGLDYYLQHEWWYDRLGGHCPSPAPLGFAAIAQQYGERYDVPLMLTETNVRGTPSDRASWLRFTLEQYELAQARGVPLIGYCWYPQVDSCDWDSLLARAAGRVDPVGVYSLSGGKRIRTLFTEIWEAAAGGQPAADLPAYRFGWPLKDQLRGFGNHLQHWDWEDPPGAAPTYPNSSVKEPQYAH